VATELHRSLSESIQAAEKAANTEGSNRQQRISRLKAGLAQIDALRQDARALLTAPGNRS
jgi:hypothetical protein